MGAAAHYRGNPARNAEGIDSIGDKVIMAHDVVIVVLGEIGTDSSAARKVDSESATLIGDSEGAGHCLVRAFSLAARKNGLNGCGSSTATTRYSGQLRTCALSIYMMQRA